MAMDTHMHARTHCRHALKDTLASTMFACVHVCVIQNLTEYVMNSGSDSRNNL